MGMLKMGGHLLDAKIRPCYGDLMWYPNFGTPLLPNHTTALVGYR